MERAFFLIKPDGISRETTIMTILSRHFAVEARRNFQKAPMNRMAALYSEHRGKPFFPWLMEFFSGKPIEALLLNNREGINTDIHQALKEVVGHTNPKLAAPGTIRALSDDDMDLSVKEGRSVRNLVHRSRNPEESQREGSLFFFDRPGPECPEMEVHEKILKLVDPIHGEAAGIIEGFFYDERFTSLLRREGIIPREARLTGCHEKVKRFGRGRLFMEITFSLDGQERAVPAMIHSDGDRLDIVLLPE